jgi:hypothetical protein
MEVREVKLKKNIQKILTRLHSENSRFNYFGTESEVVEKGPDKGKMIHDVVKFKTDAMTVHVDKHNLMVSIAAPNKSSFLHPNSALVENVDVFFKVLGEYQQRFDNYMSAMAKQQQNNFNNPNIQ